MSANCIKKAKDRKEIVQRASEAVVAAALIFKKNPDPDKAHREIEKAYCLLLKAMGPEYPDRYEGEPVGLNWLMEHYYS